MKKFLVITVLIALVLPSSAGPLFAATAKPAPYKPVYGGWLPFWKQNSGAAETTAHLNSLAYFSPFSYEVDPEIGIKDVMVVDQPPWPELFAAARAKGVKIVPTIANFQPNFLHSLLSDPVKRANHIEDIWGTILIGNYDGVDIDYENKKLETKPYYSKFIKELAAKLHANKKVLACTVEPRTPASSRFAVTRPPVEYASDYAVLNKYCDEVRIMAYDQGNIDLKLNKTKGSKAPYFPVADPEWVEKVILETRKTISASKLVLGIPTYGYEFQLDIANVGLASVADAVPAPGAGTASGNSLLAEGSNSPVYNFSNDGWVRARSLTFKQASDLAAALGTKPIRNAAGELSIVYATTSPSRGVPVIRVAWYNDAQSIAQKLALVKKYKLRGAFFFKFDGEADPAFWNLF